MNAPAVKGRDAHLRDYLRILYRRRWPALAVFVVAAAVSIVRASLSPPAYLSSTRILIEKSQVQNIGVTTPFYSSWDPDFHRTQVQIILSVATAERAARALVADESYRDRLKAAIGGGEPPGGSDGALEERLARMIRQGLSATPEKESKIVTISFLSNDPSLSARVAGAVVKAYVDQLFEMKMSSSRYAIEWMTGKAREEGARLDAAERNLQAFMKSNDILRMENRAGVAPERISELGLELTRAETRHRELAAVYERLAAVQESPERAETIPAVERDDAYNAVKSQLLKAEQNLAELSTRYGQRHPAMIAARQEVSTLERRKLAEVRRIVLTARNEMELAAAREQDLRARLSSGRGEAVAANEKLVRYEELKRAVETNRQFYDTLMTRAREESLTQQLQGVQVFTLEPPQVPDAPYGPRAIRTIMIGLALGLLGALGMALFVEYLDNTVRSPEDLELKTGIPALGVIPPVRSREKSIETAMLRDPRQPAAESYRALRTSVLLSSEEGAPKCLLVTSTSPEEGKTATAVNLAVACAQSGYSVLLIDADMRKPRVGAIFGLSNDYGLSFALQGDESPAPEDVGVANLSVLSSGPVPPNPSELLGSKRMDTLLKALRKSYDMIVIDSPPFLTVADGLVLARKVDAMLLVARSEHSTYDGVGRGIKALRDINVRPLGFVLNAYDEKRGGAYYYYHEHYYEAEPAQGARRKKRRSRRAEATG